MRQSLIAAKKQPTEEKNMEKQSESRTSEITAALLPAYQQASRLKITKAEAKRLTHSFPDKQVEVRPNDGAIYIPHIFLSQRLNEVFGPGSWSLICREHYHDEEARMLYAEHILIIRGCFVGEAVGEHPFNSLTNAKYGDALESSAAEALRRICGKRLSCGNQVWQPAYCQSWLDKFAEQKPGEIFDGRTTQKVMLWRKKGAKNALDPVSETPVARGRKARVDDNMRNIMLQVLCIMGKENVLEYAIAKKILNKKQTLEDWPLDKVVASEKEVRAMELDIQAFFEAKGGGKSARWTEFIIPFGAMKDHRLGELKKEDIHGYWETMTGSKLKSHADFKAALDEAAKTLGLQKLKGRK